MPPARSLLTTARDVDPRFLLLSFASGSMDALSFLKLGEVFTSAMTGNTALLGLALGRGNLLAASRSLAAFLGFLAGVSLGALLLRTDDAAARWSAAVLRVIRIETGCLLAFCALWLAAASPAAAAALYGLILLSALAMGLQTAAVAHMRVPGVTTTYFTGTLATVIGGVIGRRGAPGPPGRDTRRQGLIFLAYLVSACLTGVVAQHSATILAILPLAAVSAVAFGAGAGARRA